MTEVKRLGEPIELMTYPTPDKAEPVLAITYQVGSMPPRTIYIKKADYSEDKVREAVKADMDKVTKSAPQTLEV